MAIQTKIDGGKQAITFYKDTEPCAVYVDGELQQDVSFVPSDLVQGTGSISYTSEYKKNQLNMEIQGTTYQYSYEGNITETQSLTPYASFVEDYTISSYGRILRSVQPISLPDTTQDLYFSLIDYESIASQIPLYETLFLINEERRELYNLYTGGNAQFPQVPSNGTYYLGIVDEEDVGNDNERCYNLFVQNGSLQFEYNATTPSPQIPSPIENANVDGVDIFTTEGATADSYLDWQTGELKSTTHGTSTTDFIEVKPNTTYEFSGKETAYNGWTERRVIGYDENKEFYCVLTGCLLTNNNPWTRRFNTYEGVKYIRVSYKPTDINIYLKSIMNVEFHGKNLFSTTGLTRYKTTNLLVTENSIYSNNGQNQYNTRIIYSKLYPKGTYTVSYKKLDSGDSVRLLASVQIDSYSSWVSTAQMWQRFISSNPAYNPVENPKREQFTFTMDRPFQIGFALLGLGQPKGICDIMLCREKNAPYEPYYGEELVIPTSVTYTDADETSKTVSLLFSEWDKLTVDRANNKVTYTEGSWYRKLTGVYKESDPEAWTLSSYATSHGYGNYYVLYMANFKVYPVYMKSCSNMFKLVKDQHPQPDNTLIDQSNLLQFVIDREMSLSDWRLWLQQKYAEGDPVTVLIQRKTPIEHDITNTDLGQSLINLATENNINYIEVQGNGKAPAIPIKTTYAKWGGNN